MLRRCHYPSNDRRDLRIDWLRGLAMCCVIINHSRLSSLLTWVSYERFWVVTAAEVFVVLSGVVLGTVYGRRLVRDGWLAVVRGLAQRAALLYAAIIAVTLSLLVFSLAGIDVRALAANESHVVPFWFLDPRTMTASAWRDVALMRSGPWAFEIVGLYVWLVVLAAPCLLVLRFAGWRPLLAVSWGAYLWYRLAPHALTTAQFESSFPLLVWQLLFVHGVAIGYHREQLATRLARSRKVLPLLLGATAVFTAFALCNPWTDGPYWLRWDVVSADRFSNLYFDYFRLSDLRIGRLLNLAVALPVGYALLTWFWTMARPIGVVLVSLGRQSLGAFVLHVYGLLLLANLPLNVDDPKMNTLIQLSLIVAIAALLNGAQRVLRRRGTTLVKPPAAQPLAA